MAEYLEDVVNVSDHKTPITGVKRLTNPLTVTQNATFQLFNELPLDLSTVLTTSGNQTITGNYSFENLTSRAIELRAINGRDLSEYVKTAGTNETQVITGELQIDHVSISGPLTVESHTLNGCNLTHYLDIKDVVHFDSLSIADGTLLLEQPWENNRNIASLVLE